MLENSFIREYFVGIREKLDYIDEYELLNYLNKEEFYEDQRLDERTVQFSAKKEYQLNNT